MTSLPDSPDSPRRPTPVRVLMAQEAAERAGVETEAERKDASGNGRGGSSPRAPRIITADGAEWTVTAAGSTRSGTGSDRGAPLLLVRFERNGVGSGMGSSGAEAREALAVTTSLDDMGDAALLELMARTRPVPAPHAATRRPTPPGRRSE